MSPEQVPFAVTTDDSQWTWRQWVIFAGFINQIGSLVPVNSIRRQAIMTYFMNKPSWRSLNSVSLPKFRRVDWQLFASHVVVMLLSEPSAKCYTQREKVFGARSKPHGSDARPCCFVVRWYKGVRSWFTQGWMKADRPFGLLKAMFLWSSLSDDELENITKMPVSLATAAWGSKLTRQESDTRVFDRQQRTVVLKSPPTGYAAVHGQAASGQPPHQTGHGEAKEETVINPLQQVVVAPGVVGSHH